MTFAASYLHEPDLFPGRASGESWGDESLRLDIAGGPYRWNGLSASQAAVLRRELPLRVLSVEPAAGDVEIMAFRAPESDFRVFSTVGWQTAFDIERAGDTVLVAGRRLLGRIEFGDGSQRTSAALWTSADGTDAEWHGLAENFLRVLVAHRVLGQGGVLLHSAAVVNGDGAFVFFGHSGAGKSTLCALSAERGLQVLSDELNALVPSGDGFCVERLPFAGDFGRSGGARESFSIAGLHALAQGLPHAILPLARVRAVGALSACAPFVNDDPQGGPRLLENLEHLTRATSVSTLRFGLDPSFWDTLISRP